MVSYFQRIELYKNISWTFAQIIILRISDGTEIYPGDVIQSGTCATGCLLELNQTNKTNIWMNDGDEIKLVIDHFFRIFRIFYHKTGLSEKTYRYINYYILFSNFKIIDKCKKILDYKLFHLYMVINFFKYPWIWYNYSPTKGNDIIVNIKIRCFLYKKMTHLGKLFCQCF